VYKIETGRKIPTQEEHPIQHSLTISVTIRFQEIITKLTNHD